MNPISAGLATALGWGSADFIARYPSKIIGFITTLLGMLLISSILMTIFAWYVEAIIMPPKDIWFALVLSAFGAALGTMVLYYALSIGPASIVSPIISIYPVFNITILMIFMGLRPSIFTFFAFFVVMVGVLMVSKCSVIFEDVQGYSREVMKKTIFSSLLTALIIGIGATGFQMAAPVLGEITTVFWSRWISTGIALIIFILFAKKEDSIINHYRLIPVIILQGILDCSAYITLAAGSHNPESGAVTVFISTATCVVTSMLARIFLKEPIGLMQWSGIGIIILGCYLLGI